MVIKGASYYCYDKFNQPYGGATSETRLVSFYSWDGNVVQTMVYGGDFVIKSDHAQMLLDPEAPKPQVYKVQKKKFYVGKEINKTREVIFILFLDRCNNIIGYDEYHSPDSSSDKDLQPYQDKYDLSQVPYCRWDTSGDIDPINDVRHPRCSIL